MHQTECIYNSTFIPSSPSSCPSRMDAPYHSRSKTVIKVPATDETPPQQSESHRLEYRPEYRHNQELSLFSDLDDTYDEDLDDSSDPRAHLHLRTWSKEMLLNSYNVTSDFSLTHHKGKQHKRHSSLFTPREFDLYNHRNSIKLNRQSVLSRISKHSKHESLCTLSTLLPLPIPRSSSLPRPSSNADETYAKIIANLNTDTKTTNENFGFPYNPTSASVIDPLPSSPKPKSSHESLDATSNHATPESGITTDSHLRLFSKNSYESTTSDSSCKSNFCSVFDDPSAKNIYKGPESSSSVDASLAFNLNGFQNFVDVSDNEDKRKTITEDNAKLDRKTSNASETYSSIEGDRNSASSFDRLINFDNEINLSLPNVDLRNSVDTSHGVSFSSTTDADIESIPLISDVSSQSENSIQDKILKPKPNLTLFQHEISTSGSNTTTTNLEIPPLPRQQSSPIRESQIKHKLEIDITHSVIGDGHSGVGSEISSQISNQPHNNISNFNHNLSRVNFNLSFKANQLQTIADVTKEMDPKQHPYYTLPESSIDYAKWFLTRVAKSSDPTLPSPFEMNPNTELSHSFLNLMQAKQHQNNIKGQFITQKLFVPIGIWSDPYVPIKDADIKISICKDIVGELESFVETAMLDNLKLSNKDLIDKLKNSAFDRTTFITGSNHKKYSADNEFSSSENHDSQILQRAGKVAMVFNFHTKLLQAYDMYMPSSAILNREIETEYKEITKGRFIQSPGATSFADTSEQVFCSANEMVQGPLDNPTSIKSSNTEKSSARSIISGDEWHMIDDRKFETLNVVSPTRNFESKQTPIFLSRSMTTMNVTSPHYHATNTNFNRKELTLIGETPTSHNRFDKQAARTQLKNPTSSEPVLAAPSITKAQMSNQEQHSLKSSSSGTNWNSVDINNINSQSPPRIEELQLRSPQNHLKNKRKNSLKTFFSGKFKFKPKDKPSSRIFNITAPIPSETTHTKYTIGSQEHLDLTSTTIYLSEHKNSSEKLFQSLPRGREAQAEYSATKKKLMRQNNGLGYQNRLAASVVLLDSRQYQDQNSINTTSKVNQDGSIENKESLKKKQEYLNTIKKLLDVVQSLYQIMERNSTRITELEELFPVSLSPVSPIPQYISIPKSANSKSLSNFSPTHHKSFSEMSIEKHSPIKRRISRSSTISTHIPRRCSSQSCLLDNNLKKRKEQTEIILQINKQIEKMLNFITSSVCRFIIVDLIRMCGVYLKLCRDEICSLHI